MYSQRDGLKDVWYVWIGALGRVIRDLIYHANVLRLFYKQWSAFEEFKQGIVIIIFMCGSSLTASD